VGQQKTKSLTIIAHPTHPSGFSFYHYLPNANKKSLWFLRGSNHVIISAYICKMMKKKVIIIAIYM